MSVTGRSERECFTLSAAGGPERECDPLGVTGRSERECFTLSAAGGPSASAIPLA